MQADKKQIKEAPRRKRPVMLVDVEIGQRLRGLRKAHRMSQEDLALKTDVTYQQIQKYEMGRNKISAVSLKMFADIFNVTPNFFYGIDDTMLIKRLLNFKNEDAVKVAESWQALPTKELRTSTHNLMNAIIGNYKENRKQGA